MKRILASIAVLLVVALAVLLAQKKKRAAGDPSAENVAIAAITQGDGNIWHTTPRQECRSLITDSRGRLWTIGVESDGDEERNATRQFISLGRFEDVHWSPALAVTHPGAVYYPAAAPDRKGGLWLAWSEFDDSAQTWRVHTAYFDGEKLTDAVTPRPAQGPQLRPAVIVEPDDRPLVTYESGEEHRFVLRAAKFDGRHWSDEVVAATDSNFRPFLALDRDGRTWLAWDRFTQGAYRVLLRSRKDGAWQPEIPFYAGREDTQRPTLRVDSANTVWVLAGARLEGIAGGRRVTLSQPPRGRFDDFIIDPGGRFWLFRSLGGYRPNDPSGIALAVYDGKSTWERSFQMPLGYRAPGLDSKGDLWNASDSVIFRLHQDLPPAGVGAIETRTAGPLGEAIASAPPPSRVHETLAIDGKKYNLYFGEMHTHLTEFPGDRTIESWPDRFYLKAEQSGVLDFASASDHDWRWQTASKYKAIQAYPAVLSRDGTFLALSGYEWSGSDYRRRRFGDRTIIFPHPYSQVFRITDPESNTPQKLHARLASIGAIDWAHHVGAPFAVMDWTTHDSIIEPVMEMVSQHGVYETYDRAAAVPVWLKKPPVGKTSIQDGLAMGKRFGLVGSSDSHSGLSGYSNGMLAIYAESLTHDAIMDSLRHRRTFAVRGGEPMVVDFRINGHFMGQEIKAEAPPRIQVAVKSPAAIEKIEVVRDGRYIYTSRQSKFDYQDTEIGTYYYVRIWLSGDKYAWTSPVWTK